MTHAEIDAQRRAVGLPPIYVEIPRALTQDERAGRDDLIIRDADGRVLKHFVPMCKSGCVFWVDVLAEPGTAA